MSEENSEAFDIDTGVADIAEGLGLGTSHDDDAEDESEEVESSEGEIEDSGGEEKTESATPVKEAPASWAKDKHETWSTIPDDAKDYIELREKQMLDGIEQYKEGYNYGQYLDQAIAPYRDVIKANGVDEAQAIANLFMHHQAITNQDIPFEKRQQALVQIGIASGLIPQDGQPGQTAQPDRMTREIQQRLGNIERVEQQRQSDHQRVIHDKIEREVNDFAVDPKNEHFDIVADDILLLLKTGIDLPTAYEKAVWANPITRAKEMAKQTSVENGKKQIDAEKARKAAGVNIKTSAAKPNSGKKLGSWDDTMKEVLANMK